MLRLVDLFVAADAPSELAAVADLAGTPAAESRLSAYIAVAAEGVYVTVAATHLERAQAARAQTGEAQNAASLDIVEAAARLGRIDAAIAELSSMDDATRISRGVMFIGAAAMRSGGLGEDQRAQLEELYRGYRQRQRLG
jgi:hypothetical protein